MSSRESARHALLPAVRLLCVQELGVVVEEGGDDGELDAGAQRCRY